MRACMRACVLSHVCVSMCMFGTDTFTYRHSCFGTCKFLRRRDEPEVALRALGTHVSHRPSLSWSVPDVAFADSQLALVGGKTSHAQIRHPPLPTDRRRRHNACAGMYVYACVLLHMCCSLMQCVAMCCSVWQCVAWVAVFAVRCIVLQYVAVCCSVLQYVAVCCIPHQNSHGLDFPTN